MPKDILIHRDISGRYDMQFVHEPDPHRVVHVFKSAYSKEDEWCTYDPTADPRVAKSTVRMYAARGAALDDALTTLESWPDA
jgi:hypothetical protein